MKAVTWKGTIVISFIVAAALVHIAKWESVDLIDSKDRKPAPVWELKDMKGHLVKSASLKGQVVLIAFGASWCRSCCEETPNLVDLQKQYGNKGVSVIGIALDEPQNLEVIKGISTTAKIDYPVLTADTSVVKAFGLILVPSTFLVDRDGRIVCNHIGLTSKRKIEAELKSLLKS